MSQDKSRNEGRKQNGTNWEDEERIGRRKLSNTRQTWPGRTWTKTLPVDQPEIVPVDEKHPEAAADKGQEVETGWWGEWMKNESRTADWHVIIVLEAYCHNWSFDYALLPKGTFWRFFKLRSAFVSQRDALELSKLYFFLNSLSLQKQIYSLNLLDTNRFTLRININLGGKVRVRTDVSHLPMLPLNPDWKHRPQ